MYSNSLKLATVLAILFLGSCHHDAKNPNLILLENIRIDKEIKGGQTDTFYIQLDKNQFIFASLFQRSTDLCIKVIDPQNKVIKEIDYLKSGPEFISFTSSDSGKYIVLVQPFNPMAQAGTYSIRLEKNVHTNNTKNEMVNQLFSEFDNNYRTGGAVAVVDSGKIIYENAFGISDLDNQKPLKLSTRLNICSIGKQITALAIALLEQRGKLLITDDIYKYLPEMHVSSSKITIENLLNHSSGLREIADILELSGIRSSGPFSKTDALKLIYRQNELNFTPGSEYLYCNTGYILLAEIIERITHQSYMQWIIENIFKPLGMNDSQIYFDPDSLNGDWARSSYTLNHSGNYKKESLEKVWYVGAGNIFTTVEDMSKWLINFDYPKVGDKELISHLTRYTISMDKSGKDLYSLGRILSNYRGLKYFWHGGGGNGYTAQIVHFPEYQFGVIVLSNFIYGGVYGRARQIADIYLVDYFTSTTSTALDYLNPYKPVAVQDSVLQSITGFYVHDSGIGTKISKEANGLFIQSSGSDKTELYSLSDSTFFIKEADLRFTFLRDDSGQVYQMVSCADGQKEISRKVAQLPENSTRLGQYIGKYYSQELDTYYNVYQLGNNLLVHHNINGEIKLTWVNKNIFKGDRWYFSQIEFKGSADSEINEFRVSNERVRDISFKKIIQ